MAKKVHTYKGEKIDVHYDVARCIHAGECAHGLSTVFDPDKKPWVDANAATPTKIVETIHRCPTGALTYDRKDGGSPEAAPDRNVIWFIPHGPIHIRGAVHLESNAGITDEVRVSLCRCGDSKNKPFCDGSHANNFKDPGSLGSSNLAEGRSTAPRGPLEVSMAPNGPLLIRGPFELADADFRTRCSGSKASLCRCGDSGNKPFCDGSHKGAGFEG